jgi:Arabinose-binding domain of AraC transcription regulator, N-term
MVREFAGVAPDGVLLSRFAPEDSRPCRRFFGVAPRFDSEQNAVAFPARLLAAPVRTADPALRQILLKSVASYWALQQPSVAPTR